MASAINALKQLFPLQLDGDFNADAYAESEAFDEIADKCKNIIRDVVPSTAVDTLADWEDLLKISAAPGATTDQRRTAITAKLKEKPLLTPAYIAAILEANGYTVYRVQLLQPFMCGIGSCSDRLWTLDSLWALRFFIADCSDLEKATLVLLIDRLKLAYLTILIDYVEE